MFLQQPQRLEQGRYNLKGSSMFSTEERLTAAFIALVLVMLITGAGFKMSINRDCVQSAINQNYPAESIRQICR